MHSFSIVTRYPQDLERAPGVAAVRNAVLAVKGQLREQGLDLDPQWQAVEGGLAEEWAGPFEAVGAAGLMELALRRAPTLAQIGLIRSRSAHAEELLQLDCRTAVGSRVHESQLRPRPQNLDVDITAFVTRELLSCIPAAELLTYWQFFAVRPGDPPARVNIIHTPLWQTHLEEELPPANWQQLLQPLAIPEDFAAVSAIESVLSRIGQPYKSLTVDVLREGSSLRQPCIWICAPRNQLASRLLGALGQRAGFGFDIRKLAAADERLITWRQQSGDVVEVRSPLAGYLRASRRPSASAAWRPLFADIIARDFAVLARFAIGSDVSGRLLHHFFLGGIRGLGTWGAGWLVEHRPDLLAHALERCGDADLQILLQVDYVDGEIADVADVSDQPQAYFDEQVTEALIRRRAKHVVLPTVDQALDETRAEHLLALSGLMPHVGDLPNRAGVISEPQPGLATRDTMMSTSFLVHHRHLSDQAKAIHHSGLQDQAAGFVIGASGDWRVGERCRLDVKIRVERVPSPEPVEEAAPFVTVIVSARRFEKPQSHMSLRVSEADAALHFRFELVPRLAGETAVEVEIFRGPVRLGYAVLTAHVADRADPEPSKGGGSPALPPARFPVEVYEEPHIRA